MHLREGVAVLVPFFRQLVQQRASGIRYVQHPRHLVEGFPRRVVHRVAQQFVFAVLAHVHQMAVSAAGHQAHERRLERRVRHEVRAHVALYVVDLYQRHIKAVRQGFGEAHAREQCAYQPGAICDRHRVYAFRADIRVFKRVAVQGTQRLHVHAAGDLRHHAAVQRVDVYLAGDLVSQHLPAVSDYRDGGLVAA